MNGRDVFLAHVCGRSGQGLCGYKVDHSRNVETLLSFNLRRNLKEYIVSSRFRDLHILLRLDLAIDEHFPLQPNTVWR